MAKDQAGDGVPPRLSIRGVAKHFEAVQALRGVSFDLAPGEVHAVVGENGAGKSTLVGIITGLQSASSGEILLDGKPIAFRSPLEARAAGIAAVYQDPKLFPHLSVAENIATGQYPTRGPFTDSRAMRQRAAELLAEVGYPLDVDRLVASLTVAEAQFVEIARALSTDLKLLILDEPTSALTPGEATKLYEVVRRVQAKGTTVVWISHRMEEIRMLADTITVLRDGQHVETRAKELLSEDEMIRLMVGRSVVLEQVARETELGEIRLEVEHLSVPGVFDDISFQVRAGEIVGVAGLVGSGRTEITQAIVGLAAGLKGKVKINGKAVRPKTPGQMAALGVVYLPEDRDREGIISPLSITDNIALPSLKRLSRFGFMRRHSERETAITQQKALSIKGAITAPVASLSGGNRQKVAIARLLALGPNVLLLDEPTHGIDVGTKAQVHEIMRDLARTHRMAILMVSSDLPEVLAVSDRVLVISRGRLSADIAIADATQENILAAATGTTRKAAR